MQLDEPETVGLANDYLHELPVFDPQIASEVLGAAMETTSSELFPFVALCASTDNFRVRFMAFSVAASNGWDLGDPLVPEEIYIVED